MFLFFEMLLGLLGCINFTMSLSKNLMWHTFIFWCKPKGLHSVLVEFNLQINMTKTQRVIQKIYLLYRVACIY